MVKYEIILSQKSVVQGNLFEINPNQKALPEKPHIIVNPDNQIVMCQKKDGNWQMFKYGVAATLGVAGIIAGPAIIAAAFSALGLSSAGPVAGGIFAGAQGSGLAAGSI